MPVSSHKADKLKRPWPLPPACAVALRLCRERLLVRSHCNCRPRKICESEITFCITICSLKRGGRSHIASLSGIENILGIHSRGVACSSSICLVVI
eukprot:scaffold37015_cov47-Prasinocladus_malaysianus.AAC.1